jgi:N-formylmaleamate deformylase
VRNGSVVLHYLDYGGDLPGLVVIPGITSPAATWDFVARRLASEFHVVSLDLRGRGLSDPGEAGEHGLPTYAEDVLAVQQAAKLTRPVLLGHSLGARVATAFGVLHPDDRGPVLVIDPPLTGPGRPAYPTSLESFLETIDRARSGLGADDVRARYPHWSDEQVETRAKWVQTCTPESVRESYLNFDREDFWNYWRALQPPACLIYGELSPMYVELSNISDLRDANPFAALISVANAGHMIPWDNFEGFLAALRVFLETNSDAPAGDGGT